jgi:exodeoxyribonuclease V alpha subunit
VREKTEKALEHLEGTVEGIIFYNEENGFAIMDVSVEDELITVKGTILGVAEGEEIAAEGRYVSHPKYGQQFQAEVIQRTLPTTANAILKYLSSRAIKGVGPAIARRMVDAFGDKTLEVIEKDPQQLTRVRGISQDKARAIGEDFSRLYGIRTVMLFLSSCGLPPGVAIRVWKRWGAPALELIKDDPYVLCCDEIGVDFETVDAIALEKLEIPPESYKRLCAGVTHILRHNSRQGHTCLPRQFLEETAGAFLELSPEQALDTIGEMEQDGDLVAYQTGGRSWLYLPELYAAETTIAGRIALMLQLASPPKGDWEAETDKLEASLGITYGAQQRRAIREAMENPIFILTGGPGTGKTTTLNGILTLLEQEGLKVALAAPTGRAAKQMTEVTGREAKTIHRLLEVEPFRETLTFKRNEKNPIPVDAIIVDEMSMVDVLILESLFRGMKLSCKLILVGDSDQLPSVSAGQVLGDLIASGCVPTVHLDEVFRQAAESLIVVNAHAIVGGELPQLDKKDKDFFFLPRQSSRQVQELVADLCARRLPASYGFRPLWDIQVITPSRQGALGTRELNAILQARLNPEDPQKSEFTALGRTLREGDKVMQIRNNYDIPWENDSGQKGEGIFNGDIGVIDMIDPSSKTILVRFDDIVVPYSFDSADQLEHAYAITIHKSQGSEFEAVVMPLMGSHRNLHYRNLLYTGVTRARKLLILAGEKDTVARMVRNNQRAKRYTNLRSMLEEAIHGLD